MLSFPENKKFDAILLGRVALDINPADFSKTFAENATFNKFVGGSPANTAVGMAKMGKKVGIISCVSDDSLGEYCTQYMKDNNVDTEGISVAKNGETLGLSFVEIKDGATNLMMYRSGAVADLALSPDSISEEYIASAKLLLISGTALAASPSREAAIKAMLLAQKNDIPVVFDIDYRPQTWKSRDEIAVYYTTAARYAKIILGSREEFDLMDSIVLPDATDEETAKMWFSYGAEILVIKHGKEGSAAYLADGSAYTVKPFPIQFLKATGGGDAYSSAFLSALLSGMPIDKCLERGTASASLAVAATNCSDALPTDAVLTAFIDEAHKNGVVAVTPK